MLGNRIYYKIKPYLPICLKIELRRLLVKIQKIFSKKIWPIDESAGRNPDGWTGWPDGKKFALVLTHDVETEEGHAKCSELMDLEKRNGFHSSFNFVAELYEVSSELRNLLHVNGYEIGVHGLKHDGKLYCSREIFIERSIRINKYLEDWGAVGFRSPLMHHNLEWIHDINILYDASTFDTDPFEPQPDGMKTIFPFIVKSSSSNNTYVELPYTLPQDSTLFLYMQEKNIDIWIRKLDWIARNGGMALVITHPDYMNFSGNNVGFAEYPACHYEDFLKHIKLNYEGQYWHVLPKQMASFWNENNSTSSENKTTL